MVAGSQLARRQGLAAAAIAASTLGSASAATKSGSMSSSLLTQRRNFVGQAFANDLLIHSTQVGACASLSTLLYSPLGTAMLIVLAYNVVVVCTKHVNYSMEITAKDYVQDQQLYVIMRYGILSCILLGMEVMFIEV